MLPKTGLDGNQRSRVLKAVYGVRFLKVVDAEDPHGEGLKVRRSYRLMVFDSTVGIQKNVKTILIILKVESMKIVSPR